VKSLIFLALGSSIYKKKAVARLYCNGILFDEFEIVDQLDQIKEISFDQLDSAKGSIKEFFTVDNMKNYRVYETELPEEGDIQIDIINDINNYSNGFMSRYTKVRLDYINIIPEIVFKNLSADHCDKWFFRKRHFLKDIKSVKTYYKQRYTMLQNMVYFTSFHDRDGVVNNLITNHYFGKSGSFRLNYYRKHGLYHSTRIFGYNHIVRGEVLLSLRNKYLQYENQRNSN